MVLFYHCMMCVLSLHGVVFSLHGVVLLLHDVFYHYMVWFYHCMMCVCHYMMCVCHYMVWFYYYMVWFYHCMMCVCHFMMCVCHYMMCVCHYMMCVCHWCGFASILCWTVIAWCGVDITRCCLALRDVGLSVQEVWLCHVTKWSLYNMCLSLFSSVCRDNSFSEITFVLIDWSFWNFYAIIRGAEWALGLIFSFLFYRPKLFFTCFDVLYGDFSPKYKCFVTFCTLTNVMSYTNIPI
jgi:hypothetical protein